MDASPGGDHIEGQVGDYAKNLNIGKGNSQTVFEGPVNIYPGVQSRLIDQATIDAALVKLNELPLETIPAAAPLPAGSRMPLRRNPLFVGREEELRRLATLLKGGATVAVEQTAAATGMGGIGKTQLAAAFVHHYGQFFLGGVYWLNFAESASISAEIAACGLTMPELRSDFARQDQPAQVQLVMSAWQSGLPRLLIFDNCEWPELLADWRPPSGGCRVLVTSRRSRWDAGLGVRLLALDTFRRAQSIELLHKFPDAFDVPPFAEEEESTLHAIAEELGDLPLALHLAGSYLATYRYAVTPAIYLNQLRSPELLLHPSLQTGDFSPTRHDQHVARTFALSYEQLDATNPLDALALALLTRIACFAPGEPIPYLLLTSTVRQENDNSNLTVQIEAALRRLTDLGLGKRERNGAVSLHRLIVHFVQQADPTRSQVAQQAVAATLLAEAKQLNIAGIPGPLLLWQSHLRHITDALNDQATKEAADLCTALGEHLFMIADYAAARPYYECALAVREEVLGPNHPDTATSLDNLGDVIGIRFNVHQSSPTTFDFDYTAARPYYDRALTIRE